MESAELLQRLREQRLTTLALADQINDERWRQSLMPGDGSLHDMLSHLLAWDEWAMAVFEVSLLRTLPETLVEPARHVDAFNERAHKRYRGLSREDLLAGLQAARPRLISSAVGKGIPDWDTRRIAELAGGVGFAPNGERAPRAPSVRGMLRILLGHEKEHDDEIATTFAIAANLDQFKPTNDG